MKYIALVDCNNFFVSCERVFNPLLKGKPVVVLSSNDGCVISRSEEAKKIGIKMGEPFFNCRDLLKKNKGHFFSSNFTLYADMSSRVMTVLSTYSSKVEEYSIDEAFIYLPEFYSGFDLSTIIGRDNFARFLKNKIKQLTGIPVSIGIGVTKTLAKIANYEAKKNRDIGFFDITENCSKTLANMPVGEVWGVGSKYKKRLNQLAVYTALDLANLDNYTSKKYFNIVMQKTIYELNGISVLGINEIKEPKKSITVSRSFGIKTSDYRYLEEAISCFASRAAEKLRRQESNCSAISIFLVYYQYNESKKFYASTTLDLLYPTNNSSDLIKSSKLCLSKIFKEGYHYKKAGICLLDLSSSIEPQSSFLEDFDCNSKKKSLMKSLDKINNKFGQDKVYYLALGNKQKWLPKCFYKSSKFTTSWKDILTIKI